MPTSGDVAEKEEIDTPDFAVSDWSRAVILQKPLADVVFVRDKLQRENDAFNAELQTMVYSNYSNYAAGTKLIGGLKERVVDMTAGLTQLEASIKEARHFMAETTARTKAGGEDVERLVAITATLAGVRLLLELPMRLQRSLENNELGVGVRLWIRGRGVLQKHIDVPSLRCIREQCEPMVAQIEARLWNAVATCDPKLIRKSVDPLRQVHVSSEGFSASLTARIAGGLASRIDAVPLDSEKYIESLTETVGTLSESLQAGGLAAADILKSAEDVVSHRLGLLANHMCVASRSKQGTALEKAQKVAGTLVSHVARISEALLYAVPPALVKSFVRKTLSRNVAGAVASPCFSPFEPAPRQTSHAQDCLLRAILLYFLSNLEYLKGLQFDLIGKDTADTIRLMSDGVLNRYAAGECVEISRLITKELKEANGFTDTPTSVSAFGISLCRALSSACERLSSSCAEYVRTDEITLKVLRHAMSTVAERLRGRLIDAEADFQHLRLDLRYIAKSLVAYGMAKEEVTKWEQSCSITLADRSVPAAPLSELSFHRRPSSASEVTSPGHTPLSPTPQYITRGLSSTQLEDGALLTDPLGMPASPRALSSRRVKFLPFESLEESTLNQLADNCVGVLSDEEESCDDGAPADGEDQQQPEEQQTQQEQHHQQHQLKQPINGTGNGRAEREPSAQKEEEKEENEEEEDRVVVKTVPLSDGMSEGSVEVVQRELEVLEGIRHRNIVSVLSCTLSLETKEIRIVSESIRGRTLGCFLRANPRLKEAEAVDFAKQVLAGLSFLHARGVVHRDVKADNVIVDEVSNAVKITDLGSCPPQLQTTDASTKGTPLWMAPEVVQGCECAPSADVWSFGILCCELLNTGRSPWPSFPSVVQALQTISHWSEPLPPKTPHGLSALANSFLRCCLSPQETSRWPSAALMRHAWILHAKPAQETTALKKKVHPGGLAALSARHLFCSKANNVDLQTISVVVTSVAELKAAPFVTMLPVSAASPSELKPKASGNA